MVSKNVKLTIKEERFVLELVKGIKQREAYKLAGYKCDRMSEAVISRKASEVFNRNRVKKRFDELHNRVIEESENESIIEIKDVLKELKGIAMDDISNYLSFRTETKEVGVDRNGNPLIDYRTIVQMKDSESIDTRNIQEIRIGKDGQFFFKLYPRDAALTKLGRYLKMFTDRIETEIDTEVTVKLEGELETWSQ